MQVVRRHLVTFLLVVVFQSEILFLYYGSQEKHHTQARSVTSPKIRNSSGSFSTSQVFDLSVKPVQTTNKHDLATYTIQPSFGQASVKTDSGEALKKSKSRVPTNVTDNSTLRAALNYSDSIKRVYQNMGDSIYLYNRTLNLPLLKLSPPERNYSFRVDEARRWLKTQTLVVAGAVRNAMDGLPSSIAVIKQLTHLFHSVTVVFVENDSTDKTRSYLYELTKQNNTQGFRLLLLGCGTINSPEQCKINITYGSSGRHHKQGHSGQLLKRSLQEESVDRGLVMAALRNMYLQFIYDNIQADLLLVIDADLRWDRWDMNSVLQGLHHFKTKPKMDSLCAFTTFYNGMHDPCTLIFFHNKYFYVDAEESLSPFLNRIGKFNKNYEKHLNIPHSKAENVPVQPVKVASCFQGATFYRVSSLRAASAFHRYSEGEWHCEHSTLSKQLGENYLDVLMRVSISGQRAG